MLQSMNFPLSRSYLAALGGASGLRRTLAELGLDGVEGIWSGEELPPDFPPGLLTGYHLTFFPDWLDYYRNNETALALKFGSAAAARDFYGAPLLELYRADLARALALGAKYVVFHVSDVSPDEGYTYRWLHSDEAVIDASVELINALLDGVGPDFDFLVENQWWPGFTFTEPAKTQRLLDGIAYSRKGILLDTGHLMNTSLALKSEAEGVAYIEAMLERHGAMSRMIRGVHLHQSLSGPYVQSHTGALPEVWPEDYVRQFSISYAHIQNIDRHQPWTDPSVGRLLERLDPKYLTHELSAGDAAKQVAAVRVQMETLRKWGATHESSANGVPEH